MHIRKGQAGEKLDRAEFEKRMREKFLDPNFKEAAEDLDHIIEIAFENYRQGRKAPLTRKAGPEFNDASYELSVEWLATRERLLNAQVENENPTSKSRILIICASPRNDGTCPGEISKSFRLTKIAEEIVRARAGFECEILDLSRLTNEYGRVIYPCKGCVSTAMPLCHWPCSCYPNNSLAQTGDWMADIYEMWVRAHGVMIITPVHWYQVPSTLKLMIDRLVCADGGNADPTSTHGKKAEEAKQIELNGWSFPKHLSGRAFSVVVHADTNSADEVRRNLTDWLCDLDLIPAGPTSELSRYIGYYQPYATSHDELDKDVAFQDEVRRQTEALISKISFIRSGKNHEPREDSSGVRPK